jgi:hypothetical protein
LKNQRNRSYPLESLPLKSLTLSLTQAIKPFTDASRSQRSATLKVATFDCASIAYVKKNPEMSAGRIVIAAT